MRRSAKHRNDDIVDESYCADLLFLCPGGFHLARLHHEHLSILLAKRSAGISTFFLVLLIAALSPSVARAEEEGDSTDVPAIEASEQSTQSGTAEEPAMVEEESSVRERKLSEEASLEGPPLPPIEGPPGKPGRLMQALERSQMLLSDTVTNLSRRMDRMLGAREVYPEETYDSVLRLRIIQHIEEGGNEIQGDVSGRISLPGTEDRIGVIFTSEDYEDPLDRERGTERELSATEPRRRSFAVRLLQPIEDWETSISAGLRTGGSGSPIDAVLRGRLWRMFEVGTWHMRPRESIFWYGERGTGGSTEIRFEHPLSETTLIRSETGATWFQRDDQFYYDQVFSVLQPLGRKDELLWQVGAQAESEPNTQMTNYYLQIRLRHVTYRDWLIFEITPQFLRDRDNDYKTEQRIFMGFELLFGRPGSY